MPTKRLATVVDGVIHIPLSDGSVALVDLEDADLGEFNWSRGTDGYAYRGVGGRKDQYKVTLHRTVADRMGLPAAPAEVDHRNGDRLNCRRGNLRTATVAQNRQNQKLRSDNRSGHKGVSWNTQAGKWQVVICAQKRRIDLGRYADLELAAFVYDEAAHRYHGDFRRAA